MQLGYDVEFVHKTSTPVELFAIKEAVYVTCGGNNTALINRAGKLFTLGCNSYGQRGIGKKRITNPAPTEVTFPVRFLLI